MTKEQNPLPKPKSRLYWWGKRLYKKLKAIYDPRTGPEIRLMYRPNIDMIDAETSSFAENFVGEIEDVPTTWCWMPEFGVPKQNLKKDMEGDRMVNGWIWDFFRHQLGIKKEEKPPKDKEAYLCGSCGWGEKIPNRQDVPCHLPQQDCCYGSNYRWISPADLAKLKEYDLIRGESE
jgi:hypothetical protein